MANGLKMRGRGREAGKKAAIYIRVSTTYQVDKDSLPMQRKDLTAYAELMLGTTDYEIFEDAGYSGKNTDRPAFQEMMARVRQGEFSHILVWKIDRISRNLLDFSQMYSELQKLRVTFVSKNEQFDTSTAMGEAMLKIILVFAELERNMASERVTATMISRANQGLWNGGRIPFGYDYDPDTGNFSVVDGEADTVRLMCDIYLRERSTLLTAKALNDKGLKTRIGGDWNTSSVWQIITNPFYAGVYRYNRFKGAHRVLDNQKPLDEWVVIDDHHEAIISKERQEEILAVLAENSNARNAPGSQCKRKYTHVFRSIVFCGKCGARMSASPTGKKKVYSSHMCDNRKRKKSCDNAAMSEIRIGEFVLNYVLNMMQAKAHFSKIKDPAALQSLLLRGSTFSSVEAITPDGLNLFFCLLSRYQSDDSYILAPPPKPEKQRKGDSEKAALHRELDRQTRALKRLQDLFLYSDKSIPEKDFIIRKSEIVERIDEVREKLADEAQELDRKMSDDDFVRQASHLLIASRLQNKEYIYYKRFVDDISREVLQEYFKTIIDRIVVTDGRVVSITFKNGLTHSFRWK